VAVDIADKTSAEDEAFSFTVPAFTDVDNASLTYTATLGNGDALPTWLSFDATTRTFSGTPPTNFDADVTVRVTGSDGSLSASNTFTLTSPRQRRAVAVDIADKTSAEDEAFSFTVPAFTDVDNASLTYTATLGNGDALPTGCRSTSTTRTFSALRPPTSTPTSRFRVTGSDGSLSAANTFTLDITPSTTRRWRWTSPTRPRLRTRRSPSRCRTSRT
jgi:lysozyme family protein